MAMGGFQRLILIPVCAVSACASLPHGTEHAAMRAAGDFSTGQAVEAAPIQIWPRSRWWVDLKDPQLDRLLEIAVASNPRISIARSRIEEARAFAKIAGAAEKPTVSASTDLQYTHFTHDYYLPPDINGHNLYGPPVWNNSVEVGLEYRLDFWGRDRAMVDAALDEVQVVDLEERDVRIGLQAALIADYAELSYLYELKDSEQSILEDGHQILDLANRRLNAGLGTELEVEQASSAIEDAEGELQVIDERLNVLAYRIAALCGEGPGDGEKLVRPAVSVLNVPFGLPSKLPAELLGRRPDLLAQRWRVEAAAERIKVARTAFYPNVDLKAAVGLVGIGFGQLFTANAFNASAGPAITLPLFEGGKLEGALAARNAQFDEAVHAYNATLITAWRQVADALTRYQSSQMLGRHRQENLKLAKRAHELALIAFKSGLTDYVNVLATRTAWHKAQNQLAQVSLEELIAINDLNEAIGGGLEPAAEALSND